jgi:hypothetical protein
LIGLAGQIAKDALHEIGSFSSIENIELPVQVTAKLPGLRVANTIR